MDPITSCPAPGAILRVEPMGDRALILVLGEGISARVNDRVHGLVSTLRESGLPGIQDLVGAYATLTVHYEPSIWAGRETPPHEALASEIRRLWKEAGAASLRPSRPVEILVCYGGDFGPDLEEVARRCGLSPETVISRHASPAYRVFMLGFAPGFAYLGGLDPALTTPRRESPRPRVPAGSVGIAGTQTGIYPLDTPGGWQIIGRTPLKMFDPALKEPCLLRPGDRLRFSPIDEATFLAHAGDHP
jgi:KipI family sensor histidine kinase inhibitor